jgi:pilus assembly protein CpaF
MSDVSADVQITERAREILRDNGGGDVETVVRRLVEDWQKLAAAGAGLFAFTDPERAIAAIVGELTGHGPLDALVAGRNIEDVSFEGARVAFKQNGRWIGLTQPTTEAANLAFIHRLLADSRVALDESHPMLHGVEVLDGRGRLAVSIPPCARHLSAQLRLFGRRYGDLDQMVTEDTLSGPAAAFLRLVVWSKGSVLIGGETGSRKSTLLAALLRVARPNHMVRLVEDQFELLFEPQHGGCFQVTGGKDAENLSDLVRAMLRFLPDIISVGEVRGKESWDLAAASMVGAGFLATIHSRNARGSLERLLTTALMAAGNIPERLVRNTFADYLDVVVHCERVDTNLLKLGEEYTAQVTEIRTLAPSSVEGQFNTDSIFERKAGVGRGPLAWTGEMPHKDLVTRLERLLPDGVALRDVLEGRWVG